MSSTLATHVESWVQDILYDKESLASTLEAHPCDLLIRVNQLMQRIVLDDNHAESIQLINCHLIDWFDSIDSDHSTRSLLLHCVVNNPLLEPFACHVIAKATNIYNVFSFDTIALNAMNCSSFRLIETLVQIGWNPSLQTGHNSDIGWLNASISLHAIEWLDWLYRKFDYTWHRVDLSKCLVFSILHSHSTVVNWWLGKGAFVLP
jgi:hypothetical protein